MWPVWMGFALPASLAFQSTWLAFNCVLWSNGIRWLCMPERRLPLTPLTIERRGNVIFLPAAAAPAQTAPARARRIRAQVIDLPMRERG